MFRTPNEFTASKAAELKEVLEDIVMEKRAERRTKDSSFSLQDEMLMKSETEQLDLWIDKVCDMYIFSSIGRRRPPPPSYSVFRCPLART